MLYKLLSPSYSQDPTTSKHLKTIFCKVDRGPVRPWSSKKRRTTPQTIYNATPRTRLVSVWTEPNHRDVIEALLSRHLQINGRLRQALGRPRLLITWACPHHRPWRTRRKTSTRSSISSTRSTRQSCRRRRLRSSSCRTPVSSTPYSRSKRGRTVEIEF